MVEVVVSIVRAGAGILTVGMARWDRTHQSCKHMCSPHPLVVGWYCGLCLRRVVGLTGTGKDHSGSTTVTDTKLEHGIAHLRQAISQTDNDIIVVLRGANA